MNTAHAEWLNQNALRAYPFDENCMRRPSDGQGGVLPGYAVPNYVLVDFVVTVPAERMGRVYMSQMTLAGGIATFVFSSVDGDRTVGAATCRLSHDGSMNVWTPFSGSGDFVDARGAVVVGDVDKVLDNVPDGMYVFDPSETTMEARCVRPSMACVSALTVARPDGSVGTARLQGDVSLVAGQNIRLRYDPQMNAIWIDAEYDIGYKEECLCEGSGGDTCVKTINGISAEEVVIEGDGDCVSVETNNGRIVITDKCSKPCCGCEELTWLGNKANAISTAIDNLRGFADRISDRMDSIVDVGMINGTLEDRDRFTPYHEVEESLRGSPNWSIETRNAHMANHMDQMASRLLGHHADYGDYIV